MDQQDALFEVHHDDQEVGYRVTTACQVAGITYRQLDYWARTKLVQPTIRTAKGSGSQRLYSFRDILVLKIVKGLLDTGISLQNIRRAVAKLENFGIDDLAGLTLVSDGKTVYACGSPEEVIDLLNGGQGVFGIAVPGLMKELSGSITAFPAEPRDGEEMTSTDATSSADGVTTDSMVGDELAARRQLRSS